MESFEYSSKELYSLWKRGEHDFRICDRAKRLPMRNTQAVQMAGKRSVLYNSAKLNSKLSPLFVLECGNGTGNFRAYVPSGNMEGLL